MKYSILVILLAVVLCPVVKAQSGAVEFQAESFKLHDTVSWTKSKSLILDFTLKRKAKDELSGHFDFYRELSMGAMIHEMSEARIKRVFVSIAHFKDRVIVKIPGLSVAKDELWDESHLLSRTFLLERTSDGVQLEELDDAPGNLENPQQLHVDDFFQDDQFIFLPTPGSLIAERKIKVGESVSMKPFAFFSLIEFDGVKGVDQASKLRATLVKIEDVDGFKMAVFDLDVDVRGAAFDDVKGFPGRSIVGKFRLAGTMSLGVSDLRLRRFSVSGSCDFASHDRKDQEQVFKGRGQIKQTLSFEFSTMADRVTKSQDVAVGESQDQEVLIRGRMVVVDKDGKAHGQESGSFSLVLWNGNVGEHHEVVVEDGLWQASVYPCERLEFSDLIFGGRVAESMTENVPFSAKGKLSIEAKWLPEFSLHVVDDLDGHHLKDVEIVHQERGFSTLRYPSAITPENALKLGVQSPVIIGHVHGILVAGSKTRVEVKVDASKLVTRKVAMTGT